VVIHHGPLTVDANGKSVTGRGTIQLEWLPAPTVTWSLEKADLPPSLGPLFIRIPSIANPLRAHLTNVRISTRKSESPPAVSGYVENGEGLQYQGSLHAVVFHLANFIPFLGAAVQDKRGTAAARAMLQADGWRITLDRIPDSPAGSRPGRRSRAGYAISHVGQLEREGGGAFSVDDAKRMLDELYWFFSFCRAKPTPPILPVGLDARRAVVWNEWASWNVAPDRDGRNWYNDLSSEGMEALYPGFVKRLHDMLWSGPARNAIYWYLEAGRVGNDSAIVLLQAAFELIAWTYLVQDQQVLSGTKFKKLSAVQQLTTLLKELRIPLEVPGTLEALMAFNAARGRLIGPEVIVGLRNAMVHGGGKKNLNLSPQTYFQASSLSFWYLELVLLRLFDYKGKYSNRLVLSGWKGQEVEDVPWARPAA
jgi:hypothetical protein